jgi:hypothetical protein
MVGVVPIVAEGDSRAARWVAREYVDPTLKLAAAGVPTRTRSSHLCLKGGASRLWAFAVERGVGPREQVFARVGWLQFRNPHCH